MSDIISIHELKKRSMIRAGLGWDFEPGPSIQYTAIPWVMKSMEGEHIDLHSCLRQDSPDHTDQIHYNSIPLRLGSTRLFHRKSLRKAWVSIQDWLIQRCIEYGDNLLCQEYSIIRPLRSSVKSVLRSQSRKRM